MGHTVHDVPVPSVVSMHEGMRHGAMVEINGAIHCSHDRFTVELLSGPHVVLHIDFRMGFGGEHIVVVNSSSNGCWGDEVRAHNPLHHNDHFHLTIKAHHGHFDIHVNGHHICDFPHRLPMESVQAVGFRGMGHVHKVHFDGFGFHHTWGHHDHGHFGHGGWHGYGTDGYVAPVFSEGHHYNSFYNPYG